MACSLTMTGAGNAVGRQSTLRTIQDKAIPGEKLSRKEHKPFYRLVEDGARQYPGKRSEASVESTSEAAVVLTS